VFPHNRHNSCATPRNTVTQRAQHRLTPYGGGGEPVASVRARRKEENRLLLKEWFAQKREIPDSAGMSHISTVLRRIVERESA
jgi:hypothetical protein